MKDIDFLPDVYRHRQVLRHARLWWGGVAVLFSLAIGATASFQYYFRHRLNVQLAAIEPQYAAALQRDAELADLKAQVTATEELAALYLYLKHPWPRTQLLAAVAAPLPETIRLVDLRLIEESANVAIQPVGDRDVNNDSGKTGSAEIPSAKALLARLRSEFDRTSTILELSGQASSIDELHTYVDSLARFPLIASASLKGLESGGEARTDGSSRFHLRVVIRPGHGQPGAPGAKMGELASSPPASEQFAIAGAPGAEGGSP